VSQDVDLKAEHLEELADDFASIVERNSGKPFPADPYEQLEIAVGAVFRSWMASARWITAASSRSPRRWPTARR
jgi:hypothetical protein